MMKQLAGWSNLKNLVKCNWRQLSRSHTNAVTVMIRAWSRHSVDHTSPFYGFALFVRGNGVPLFSSFKCDENGLWNICAPKMDTFGQKWPKKWHFEWPNQNSKTTFIVQTFPKYGPYGFDLVNLSLLGKSDQKNGTSSGQIKILRPLL